MAVENGKENFMNLASRFLLFSLLLLVCACARLSSYTSIQPTFTTASLTDTLSSPTMVPPSPMPVPTGIPLPPKGYLYQGAYPGCATCDEDDITIHDLRSYEQTAGKTVTWVYFSNNWYRGRKFPLETATWIREAGNVPFIRLMLRSSSGQNQAEPTFTLQNIIDGKFDSDFHSWCADARDFDTPILAEYGTEVNGHWFSWNGVWNGGGTLGGYGDPNQPDGPERFEDAYRHIVQICRDEGAKNITWVFHVNDYDNPDESWNRFENYYPGDEWIDWIGVSDYGAQTPQDDTWNTFRQGMDAAYPRLAALSPDKPIVLLEFGVTKNNPLGDQAQWVRDALTDITSSRWPRLIGFSWWNDWWQNDDNPAHNTTMRVQDNSDLAAVFQQLVGRNPKVLGVAVP